MAKHGMGLLPLAMFVGLGTFLSGYDSGVVTTTITKTSWIKHMNYPSQEWIGAVASFYYAGQALGCLLQVLVADRIGRIPFLQLLTAFAAIGPVIQTVSTNMQTFIAGRALAGLPTGAMYTTIALYLCEIAPAHNRGLIAGCSGLMLGLGIMISNWVGMACSYAPYGSLQWRLPIALQTPWSCILLIGLATFVPESPRYLIFQGRIAHARAVFDRLRIGYNLDEADHEFAQMTAQIDFEARRRLASSERIRLFRYRMAVALICGIIPSLTGAQVIGYYQVRLYQTLGIEVRDRLTLAGAHGTVSFLAVLFTDKLVIDRWGRRNLLLLGLAGSVFCQIYCAITQWQFAFGENTVGKAFAVLGIYLFTVVYYACFGSTPGIYQAEVLPIAVRSKVMGVTGAASLAIIAGFSESAPMAFVTIKHNYYYVFLGPTVLIFLVAWLMFPETKQRTLEEIPWIFGDNIVTERRRYSSGDSGDTEQTDR
ncbi:MFS monosaccharide transporter [Sphaerulina musiva SO2202]|uniref:MFS monosaccharide transporter n=1 Tax=Sphaerulina musiva (strain SO2202) TaxID=692275 RepID=N1QEF4_SPHMS|nr:MFS monosaccharide transporter [Sphaerulina musiva SO2202]EMF10801.1 MFS monosaccharide transporter [Sphaerulina musiva SO2202]